MAYAINLCHKQHWETAKQLQAKGFFYRLAENDVPQ